MKKTIILCVVLLMAVLVLAGCEYKTGNRITGGKDVQTFTYAYIYLDGKEIVQGYINQWRDYNSSDAIQIMIGGKYYLTHYSNVVMIADPEHGALQYSNPDNFTDE